MQYEDDIDLMLRFRNGEESCFEELVERHKQRVFNLVYRFLGSYQEAEDIAQEVFIRVYKAKDSYTPQAKFTTWLYTICKNTCLNSIRDKNPSLVSLDSILEQEDDAVAPQIADTHTPSPVECVLKEEHAALVKAAIDSLPAQQKMAVLLYRYDQLSYEEISEVMDCSVKAVKSLLHRAKLQLKEKLRDFFK